MKKEMETIKERKIMLKLSDADCERISVLCGIHDLTVAELLENFIGDLVGGTYSNGSDERMYAEQWFRRCWFGMFPEKTLVSYLLSEWEMDIFVQYLEQIENAKDTIEHFKKDIANADSNWQNLMHCEFNSDRTSYKYVQAYNSVEEYIAEVKEDIEDEESDLNDALESIKEIKNNFEKYMGEKAYVWEDEVEKVKKWYKDKNLFCEVEWHEKRNV